MSEGLGELIQAEVGLKQNLAQSGTITWRDSQKGDRDPLSRLSLGSLVAHEQAHYPLSQVGSRFN